jgi:hypothetical protein
MDTEETREVEIDLAEILVALLQPDVIAESGKLTPPPPTRDDYLDYKREFDEADAAGKRDLQRISHDAGVDEHKYYEDMAASARRGTEVAHLTLWWDALSYTAYAIPLPPPLQEYMTVDAPAFKRRPGGQERLFPTYETECIAGMVALLARNGINPYRHRNSRSDAPTACSIVAVALQKAANNLQRPELKKTEGAVEKLYEKLYWIRESAADQIKNFIKERLQQPNLPIL